MVSKQVALIIQVPYLISVKCTNISLFFYASPTQNLASPVKRIHPNYCHMNYSTPTLFRSKPMRYIQKIIYHLTKHYGKSAHSLAFVLLTKKYLLFLFCWSKVENLFKYRIKVYWRKCNIPELAFTEGSIKLL